MMPEGVKTLDYGVMLMGLAGGLALFLIGMQHLTDSLKSVAGDRMKHILGKLTTNRFTGAVAGTLVTAVIQSSSITSVLLVGFVSAGLLSLSQSVGVILGADIGTTITAQIIAFKVTKYALAMIAIGFIIEILSKKPFFRHYGSVLIGLGMLFLGMEFMSDATNPLRSYAPFLDLMHGMQHPLWGILLGTGFTALIQSSSATTGIVIVMAGQGLIPLQTGIALIFGANIGTCVTAILASIGKPREALQTALVHVIFKVLGVLIWIMFIPQFADFVRYISPESSHLAGLEQLASDAPRQIANAHTVFNVGNAVIFIWFAPWISRLAVWLAPPKKTKIAAEYQARHLDPYYLEIPATALDKVRLELENLGRLAAEMVREGLQASINGTRATLDAVRARDNRIDALHGQIVAYLSRLSSAEIGEPYSRAVLHSISVANYIENIGDIIETDLARDGITRIENNLVISNETVPKLEALHAKALNSFETAIGLIGEPDPDKARTLIDTKPEFQREVEAFRAHLAQRLGTDEPRRVETYRLESNMLEYLNRIYILARRIARIIMEIENSIPIKKKSRE